MTTRSPTSGERTLVIGLDAGDADLIDRWGLEGRLPNITRIKQQGAWGRLKTTADVFHVSAWPSIFTGTKADKHGLYHAYVMRPGHQGLLRPRPDRSPFPFVWKLLNDRGLRSIVIDAFLTCPLRDFNGVQIVDWGSWSWFWEPTMSPPSLRHEVRSRFGPYPAEDHSKVGMVPLADVAGFRQRLLAGVRTKTSLVKWLMEKEPWDFFLVVFGEPHPAGHYFWHLFDDSYVAYPRADPASTGIHHALRDVYVALDTAIGELLQSAGGRTTVWLVSGDGMSANYSGSHMLPDVLTRLGVLNAGAIPGARPAAASRDVLSTIRGLIPESLRLAVSRALLSRQMQEQLSLRWKTAGISWPHTRAFVIENANEGYIRINLRGREPEGIVSPGEEYVTLVDEIRGAAERLTNPATRQPAALAVYRTDDICDGPCRSHMPDVVIVWNPQARVTNELLLNPDQLIRSAQPACGLAPYYTGNHWPNAFLGALGPAVPAGLTLEGATVLDLAPTLLAQFGVAPPEHMDGRVLHELTEARTAPPG